MSKLTPAQALVALVGAAFTVLVDLQDEIPKKTRQTRSKGKARASRMPATRDSQQELPFDPAQAREAVSAMFRDKPGAQDNIDELFSGVVENMGKRSPAPPRGKRDEVPLAEAMNTYYPDRTNDEDGTAESQPWLSIG